MGKLSLVLLATLGGALAKIGVSLGLVAGAASYGLGAGYSPAELQRYVQHSFADLSKLAQTFGPAPRIETISVLDAGAVRRFRDARTAGTSTGGALILNLAP